MNRKEVINCKMIGLIESRFDQNSRDIEWQLITFLSLQSSVSVKLSFIMFRKWPRACQ